MPKIDVSLIEGYDTMTPEQKLAALEAYEYEDHADELERTKNALSKANSEAAESKRKLREKLTVDEQAAQQEAEEKEKLKKDNAALMEELSVTKNTAQLVALGYEAKLAAETAKAMFDGDTAKVFANQKKHQEAMAHQIEADLLKKTPKPPAGAGGSGLDYQKKLEEARSSNDFAAVAYYTRLIAEQEAQAEQ
jgi:hypothetical protein|nr:MAG TPA: hypothetical protein [Caudoviricetes sp.]